MAQPKILLFLNLFLALSSDAMAAYNIINFGAKPDGRTDSAKAFLRAWAAACSSKTPASIYVPSGKFLVSQALFNGPCKNAAIKITIDGTIFAPSGYSSMTDWVTFKYVQGLSISGGVLDGRGQAFWACKMAGKNCPQGASTLRIGQSKNVRISGMSLLNSEMFHMVIFGSTGVTLQGMNIIAPENSPNTDGIHIQMSSGVTIQSSSMRTGDDCISLGAGSTNIWMERISCGPGHGISIGSLGGITDDEGVQNITVRNAVITGTQNGVRIKTWGKPNNGFVRDVKFEHVTMRNVQNPIVVDQNYCPGNVNCPNQHSGIKISQVSYTDVKGTSATPVAVKFDCSATNPCNGMRLQDIKLTYQNKPAMSYCKNVKGSVSGLVVPQSCF
ncbi:polygalacturonase-like [Dioscorea cayenensis subsp. rotundata]|uniref:Exopolygalacturonase n=1 Tax=Dioscorea cayennensis subsp. rotundata TaxID=55577 RepID=A0AB40C3I5_DIOCR|nr:polygalacturonase-like [Dioscorea cayenensis subsp. rotundata]